MPLLKRLLEPGVAVLPQRNKGLRGKRLCTAPIARLSSPAVNPEVPEPSICFTDNFMFSIGIFSWQFFDQVEAEACMGDFAA